MTVMKNKRKLGDILSVLFPIAVALLWIFAEEINADTGLLIMLSGLALLLIVSWITVRKSRRKLDNSLQNLDELRRHIGDTDDTDQKDKYYF
jgi:ABC-type transport system involved in cytochrome bd biosynthesis fused ATPase/permease subunit